MASAIRLVIAKRDCAIALRVSKARSTVALPRGVAFALLNDDGLEEPLVTTPDVLGRHELQRDTEGRAVGRVGAKLGPRDDDVKPQARAAQSARPLLVRRSVGRGRLQRRRLSHRPCEVPIVALTGVDLLLLDDFAFEAMSKEESIDVYPLLLERTGRASMLVTSNGDTAEWLAMLDVLLAQSAVDRFKNTADHFVIEGESYRPRLKPTLDATNPLPASPAPKMRLHPRARARRRR